MPNPKPRPKRLLLALALKQEEAEDLRSCISIALQQKEKGLHKDSPIFWDDVRRLDDHLVTLLHRFERAVSL